MKSLLFLIPFCFSLSWAALAPSDRAQCHNGPIVISIQGQKENYENYKKFEADAQYYLSKAFTSDTCKYKPQDIKLNLEIREGEGSDPQKRCVSDIVGPNLAVKGNFMTLFRKVNMYYLRNPRCSTMTYPYVHSRQPQVAKIEIKKITPPPIPKRKDLKTFQHQELGTEDLSRPEGDFCPSCSYKTSPNVIDNVIKVAQSLKHKGNYTCEPQGYDQGMSKERIQQYVREGRMGELISRYSERSQGAIQRAFMAIVKPEKNTEAQEILKKYGSFESAFAHASSQKNAEDAEEKINNLFYSDSNGKCYSYIKAALSGDYSVISRRFPNHFNKDLLAQECNIKGNKKSPGDLALEHGPDWRTNEKNFINEAAGNSGPALEKRGFVNILDKKYGVVQNYIGVDGKVDEQLLPTGAVVVYQCNNNSANPNNNFSNFSNPYRGGSTQGVGGKRCKYGDIAMKTSNGYVRNVYKDVSIAASSKYVVVGVYIKPLQE